MSTQLVHAIIIIIVAPCPMWWWHLSVVVSLSLLPSLRRRQYMFRHPSEPLEPHVRRVVHTHLHPGGSFFSDQKCKKIFHIVNILLDLMCTHGSLCVVLVQSLLDEPNPNSPANSQAAQLYQENKREYEKRVTAIVEQSWVDV